VAIGAGVIRRLERRDGLELSCFREVRAGSPVGIDDPLGQQVLDGFAVLGDIRRKQMIEGAVFTDENDQVLDR